MSLINQGSVCSQEDTINMIQHKDCSALRHKNVLYPRSRVFVCPSTHARLHCFNHYAYLKLGVSEACQFQKLKLYLRIGPIRVSYRTKFQVLRLKMFRLLAHLCFTSGLDEIQEIHSWEAVPGGQLVFWNNL